MEEIDVGPLPADKNGFVTFISVNNFTKVTPQVLAHWAQIVAPRAEIENRFADQRPRQRIRPKPRERNFRDEGVEPDRIDMRKTTPFSDYLRLLESSDIMLDPFPFNGGTTTCHGLWMGNAVISLAGQMHAGRMGLSMLSCIGLPELCAPDEEAYVKIAVDLAGDLPRLREIRAASRATQCITIAQRAEVCKESRRILSRYLENLLRRKIDVMHTIS